jgi:hypothetical protein
VWYQKKRVKKEGIQVQWMPNEIDADKYSLIVKVLEGREEAKDENNIWDEYDGLHRIHKNDEWLNDNVFVRLEPVSWWIGKNATVNSPQFKAMAAVLNIHPSIYKDLP